MEDKHLMTCDPITRQPPEVNLRVLTHPAHTVSEYTSVDNALRKGSENTRRGCVFGYLPSLVSACTGACHKPADLLRRVYDVRPIGREKVGSRHQPPESGVLGLREHLLRLDLVHQHLDAGRDDSLDTLAL